MKATTLAEMIPKRPVRVAVDDDRGPVGVAVDGGDGGGDELKVYSHEHSMCCSPSSQNIVISLSLIHI